MTTQVALDVQQKRQAAAAAKTAAPAAPTGGVPKTMEEMRLAMMETNDKAAEVCKAEEKERRDELLQGLEVFFSKTKINVIATVTRNCTTQS